MTSITSTTEQTPDAARAELIADVTHRLDRLTREDVIYRADTATLRRWQKWCVAQLQVVQDVQDGAPCDDRR